MSTKLYAEHNTDVEATTEVVQSTSVVDAINNKISNFLFGSNNLTAIESINMEPSNLNESKLKTSSVESVGLELPPTNKNLNNGNGNYNQNDNTNDNTNDNRNNNSNDDNSNDDNSNDNDDNNDSFAIVEQFINQNNELLKINQHINQSDIVCEEPINKYNLFISLLIILILIFIFVEYINQNK